jgi:hypothetical protein
MECDMPARFNVVLSDDLNREIDKVVDESQTSKSEVLRNALVTSSVSLSTRKRRPVNAESEAIFVMALVFVGTVAVRSPERQAAQARQQQQQSTQQQAADRAAGGVGAFEQPRDQVTREGTIIDRSSQHD